MVILGDCVISVAAFMFLIIDYSTHRQCSSDRLTIMEVIILNFGWFTTEQGVFMSDMTLRKENIKLRFQ
jgi:hypothetical protein